MSEPTIKELYEEFWNMRGLLDLTMNDQHRLIQGVLTPEQKREIEDIKMECATSLKVAQQKLQAAEKALKGAVLESGESFKGGEGHHVTYSAGRVKWNDKGLQEMVFEYPPLATAQSKGKPFVTIRNKK